MKLITMTNYVLEHETKKGNSIRSVQYYLNIDYKNYATFLKLLLKLGMFVPCNLEGNVLEEPIMWESYDTNQIMLLPNDLKACEEYEQAKDRVLFEMEGFEQARKAIEEAIQNGQPIESLEWMDLTLTPNAVK